MPVTICGQQEVPFALARLSETGDDSQKGTLAAAGRANETQELAPADFEIDRLERRQS